MSKHYNQNYTITQVEKVLTQFKECVENDSFDISFNENRLENQEFIDNYNILHDRLKDILLSINVMDFCHSLQNIKKGYEHEVLYVFVPKVRLAKIMEVEKWVDVYVKFIIFEKVVGSHATVVSFHKLNKPILYPFK